LGDSKAFARLLNERSPTGTVELQFNAALTKFQNLVRDGYAPERFE
jgi:hypothetical protein